MVFMVVDGCLWSKMIDSWKINSSYKQLERQRQKRWPHKSTHMKIIFLFFNDYGKNSLRHIFHKYTNIFVEVEQKFYRFFWKRMYFLFLSLKSNCCISLRPMLSSNINAESARFSWFFLAKYWIKLPHFCFPFLHWHLFCFGCTKYHRLYNIQCIWYCFDPNS